MNAGPSDDIIGRAYFSGLNIMKQALLVCTGNICRTPMAEALLRRVFAEAGLSDSVEVSSAGTYGVEGGAASEGSVVAMNARDIDITAHRGRQLSRSMMQEADLVLVMAENHRTYIFHTWPQYLAKTFLLSEMAGDHADIADPIGLDQPAYDRTAEIIENYVRRGFPEIRRRLGV
ncbi:MAG: hypothetical protein J5I90_07755 [Caldilineales bacterium]|nr:hypothetical protein [Caldilineales bacterium]